MPDVVTRPLSIRVVEQCASLPVYQSQHNYGAIN